MKQKTLFACLAAFAAVFAFSACDGFGDDDTPINEFVRGTWYIDSATEEWELFFDNDNNFTLTGSKKGTLIESGSKIITVLGSYWGNIEDAGREGDLDLWGEDENGYSYDIEMDYMDYGTKMIRITEAVSYDGGDRSVFPFNSFLKR